HLNILILPSLSSGSFEILYMSYILCHRSIPWSSQLKPGNPPHRSYLRTYIADFASAILYCYRGNLSFHLMCISVCVLSTQLLDISFQIQTCSTLTIDWD